MKMLGITLERVWPGSPHLAVNFVSPYCAAWRSECGKMMLFAPLTRESRWTLRVKDDENEAFIVIAATLAHLHIEAIDAHRRRKFKFPTTPLPSHNKRGFERMWFEYLRHVHPPIPSSHTTRRLDDFYALSVFLRLSEGCVDPNLNFIGEELTDYLCTEPFIAFTARKPSVELKFGEYEGKRTKVSFHFNTKEWKRFGSHIERFANAAIEFDDACSPEAENMLEKAKNGEPLNLAEVARVANFTINNFITNELGEADTSENRNGLMLIDGKWEWQPRPAPQDIGFMPPWR